jgi:diguanylate cyclase (GGDEF)-like protein
MDRDPQQILIVDDEALNLDMLGRRLVTRGYNVATASSAAQALEMMRNRPPSLVLLDVNMPGMSGLQMLDVLKGDEDLKGVPVILVSALSDTENIVRGLQRGASDYVTKPINLPVLLARLETQLKMASLVNQLESQKEILARLASCDDLTGVLNRRSLFETLEVDLNRSTRYRHQLSVLMMDLDHFKRVNDEHGHAAGDEVLRQFAERISHSLRNTDALFRYGGEEFCVVLPETNGRHALHVAENIRHLIESRPFELDTTALHCTVSIGLATFTPPEPINATQLLERADEALYDAKNGGRNRVCTYDETSTNHTPWVATGT